MNKKKLKFLIDNYGKIGIKEISKRLDMHHTTVMHWRDKLKKENMLPERARVSYADQLIKEVKEGL